LQCRIYNIKLEIKSESYEGPFDVLVRLILSQRVNVYTLDISTIIDQFLKEFSQLSTKDLDTLTEFTYTAAILIELKTRALIYNDTSSTELNNIDFTDLLIAKMLELKTFQNASQYLAMLIENNQFAIPRSYYKDPEIESLNTRPISTIKTWQIIKALENLISTSNELADPDPHITELPPISTEEAMQNILKALETTSTQSFFEITKSCKSKIELIAYFLAMLELYKQEKIELKQLKSFGKIQLELLNDEFISRV